ncbi:MAG: aldose 1-epimerase family protein, partial [Thalassovita sp.]|nr:aldose 1-epimerase family protein [Thalassovita sp.]
RAGVFRGFPGLAVPEPGADSRGETSGAGHMDQDLTHIANARLRVAVAALGAETRAIRDARGRDYLWHGDAAFWAGRAPILFPIVGRAPGDRIAAGAHEAEMKQHGFARRSRFELVEAGADFCRHRLRDSAETRAAYPFAFSLEVSHRLVGAALEVAAQVENEGVETMPFGLGFHPAFRWPLPGATGLHVIELDNGAEPALARLEGGLLGNHRYPSPFRQGWLALDPALFTADAMIFPEGAGQGLRYGAETGPSLRLGFDGLPNLALWSKPGAGFICIEPWHGMAARQGAGGEIAERPCTVLLPPGQARRFAYTVSLG